MSDISILRLRHLVSVFENVPGRARTTGPILRGCGIPDGAIEDDQGRISIRQEAEFVRRACDALEDPLFAARAGLAYSDAATLTAYVARTCESLQQAMELASRYLALADSDTILTLEHLDDTPICSIRSRSGTLEKNVRHREFLTLGLLARVRRVAGAGFVPAGLAFRHDIRGHLADLEKLAGCTVFVEQEKTGVLLSPSALDLPISTADPGLRAFLSQHGDGLLKERQKQDQPLAEQVEAVLLQNLPGRLPSADDVAAKLGFSRRSLSRRLSEAGHPYRTILDTVRCDLAQTWLRDTQTISEIAFLLDYADQAAFSTAFKRWTGQTPNAWRKSMRMPAGTGSGNA